MPLNFAIPCMDATQIEWSGDSQVFKQKSDGRPFSIVKFSNFAFSNTWKSCLFFWQKAQKDVKTEISRILYDGFIQLISSKLLDKI